MRGFSGSYNNLVLSAFALLFLGGCVTKYERTTDSPAVRTGAPSPSGQGAPAQSGPNDSGGGTGYYRKVFEGFTVDPTTTAPYLNRIAKLFANITPSGSHRGGSRRLFARLFHLKTWYVAPIDLEKIDKETLGVSFIKSETQQDARQTLKEGWIDSRIYLQMNEQEQADLWVHELVEAIYMERFWSPKQVCLAYNIVYAIDADCPASDTPRETPHRLTAEDNENIRYVTSWILTEAVHPVDEAELYRIFYSKNFGASFDPRHYLFDPAKIEPITVTEASLFSEIHGARISGNGPTFCQLVNSNRNVSCQLDVLAAPLRLKITSDEGSIETLGYYAETSPKGYEDFGGRVLYEVLFDRWPPGVKIEVGTTYHQAYAYFEKSPENGALILNSIALNAEMVTAVPRGTDAVCPVHALKPLGFLSDTVFVTFKKGETNTMLNTRKLNFTTSTYCEDRIK